MFNHVIDRFRFRLSVYLFQTSTFVGMINYSIPVCFKLINLRHGYRRSQLKTSRRGRLFRIKNTKSSKKG